MWLLVALGLMVRPTSAAQRSPYLYFPLRGAQFTLRLGTPPQVELEAMLTMKLSEFIVVDAKCGERDKRCPRYCRNPKFANLYCIPLCHAISTRTMALTCNSRKFRYRPNESESSELVSYRGWSKSMPYTWPFYGSIYRDRLQLLHFEREHKPVVRKLLNFDITFVSALLWDDRLVYDGAAVFGLRPGPNSAVSEFTRGLGILPIMSLSFARSNDMVKTMVEADIATVVTLGAADRWRCAQWEWLAAPEFAITVPTIDFMGIKFHNVLVVIDINNEFHHISPRMADSLVAAGVLRFYAKDREATMYSYDCLNNQTVRFLNENGVAFLELQNRTLTYDDFRDKCVSLVAVDVTDISADVRAETLIWSMGWSLFFDNCFGYDYGENRIGFAKLRPWAHPFYAEKRGP